jgi:hypothetical protein
VNLEISLKSWKTNAAPICLHLRWTEIGEITTEHFQASLGREIFAEEEAEKGRLSGTARPGQEKELAFINRQREVPQRIHAAVVELGKVIALYHAACAPTAATSV